jgi:NAD(P)-dependent dehydrogenase (short-subunit alcohol dehydrogenase family)
MNIFNLNGKTAIVTGGTGLLGNEYLKVLKDFGASVVSIDLKNHNSFESYTCDISNQQQVKTVINEIYDRSGKIDILINNAAINPQPEGEMPQFVDYPSDLLYKSFDVNIMGTVYLTQEVIKTMLHGKVKGSIINVSSTYGIVSPDKAIYPTGYYKPVDYSITKSAIINFTRYIAAHYGEYGIRCNTLIPGGVFNGQDKEFVDKYSGKTPLGRMAEKNDYNGAVIFLASDASKYMTGAEVKVDGGFTCI